MTTDMSLLIGAMRRSTELEVLEQVKTVSFDSHSAWSNLP